MQKEVDDVSFINHTGNPEGVVSANPSSESHDPVSGIIYRKSTGTGNTGWVQVDGVDLHTAKFIVGDLANGANYSTIASAITAASSGDTVFIQTGTYTENLTLKAGVNLTAFGSDSSQNGTGRVIIAGTCTLTTAGTVSIYGIQLQTNGSALLAVTGSAASVVNLDNCYLNCTNATGITHSSSSSSSEINIMNCNGNLATTGIAYWTKSSPGSMILQLGFYDNTGGSTTQSTNSAGEVTIDYCRFYAPVACSSTGAIQVNYSNIDVAFLNVTGYTSAGNQAGNVFNSRVSSGTASAVSVGAGTNVLINGTQIGSSNTNAITGAGTAVIVSPYFSSTSNKTNVTTQAGGAAYGLTQGSAPSSGLIGEQISANASAVAFSSGIAKNLTSISLTPGIWDVSASIQWVATGGTGIMTAGFMGTSTTSATLAGTGGIQTSGFNFGTAAVQNIQTTNAPLFRYTLSATTTVYLVGQVNYTSTTCPGSGSISATRVG